MLNTGAVKLLLALFLLISATIASVAQASKSGRDSGALVVPAGTRIKVTFTQPRREMRQPFVIDGKVIAPVRTAWTTAVPAGSKALVRVVPEFFYEEGNPRGRRIENTAELTALVIGDAKYEVSTGSVKLFTAAGTDSEVEFALAEPLNIAP